MSVRNRTEYSDLQFESLQQFDEAHRNSIPLPCSKFSLSPDLLSFGGFRVKNIDNDLRMARTALTELGLGEPRSGLGSKDQYEELQSMRERVRNALNNPPTELLRRKEQKTRNFFDSRK